VVRVFASRVLFSCTTARFPFDLTFSVEVASVGLGLGFGLGAKPGHHQRIRVNELRPTT